jgi:heptose I phosphotransferase
MHAAGINHRDLYINHFRINRAAINEKIDPILYLMDLHRAHQQKKVPLRWLIKDLGSLLFSCLDKPLSMRDVLYFIKHYQPEMRVKDTLEKDFSLWQGAYERAKRERKRHLRKHGADPYVVAHAKGRSDLSDYLSQYSFR